jgi:serine/threonine protein kinase
VNEIIGAGSQGAVHRVTEIATRKSYAMKVVVKDYVINDAATIATEVEILKSVKHKYIANLHEVYESADKCWLLMELIDGGELLDWISEKRRYTEADVATVIGQLLYRSVQSHARYCQSLLASPLLSRHSLLYYFVPSLLNTAFATCTPIWWCTATSSWRICCLS